MHNGAIAYIKYMQFFKIKSADPSVANVSANMNDVCYCSYTCTFKTGNASSV